MSEHIEFFFCVVNIASLWINILLLTTRVRKVEEKLPVEVKP